VGIRWSSSSCRMLEQISLSSFSTCRPGAGGVTLRPAPTQAAAGQHHGREPRAAGAPQRQASSTAPLGGPHHFAVLLNALDVLLIALALLLLLDGRDDPPGRPPGANHVLVGHGQQVPLLHRQLLVVHHLRHLFHLLNLRTPARAARVSPRAPRRAQLRRATRPRAAAPAGGAPQRSAIRRQWATTQSPEEARPARPAAACSTAGGAPSRPECAPSHRSAQPARRAWPCTRTPPCRRDPPWWLGWLACALLTRVDEACTLRNWRPAH